MFGPPSEARGAGRSHGIDIALRTTEKPKTPSRPCQSSPSRDRRIRKRKEKEETLWRQEQRELLSRHSTGTWPESFYRFPFPSSS